MTFIETTPEDEASGDVAAIYEEERATMGHVRNMAKAYSVAPDVLRAWQHLNATIKGRMDLRRYELATLAAARRIRSSYCSLAHGSVLVDNFIDGDSLRAIMADHRAAGLDAVDVAVMDLADKVAADATSVTQADIDRLREQGLSDSDVFDVIAAAAARCFFSKTLDALGAEPDAQFSDMDAELRGVLTVGRPIAVA